MYSGLGKPVDALSGGDQIAEYDEDYKSFRKPERHALKLFTEKERRASTISSHLEAVDEVDQTSFKQTFHESNKNNIYADKGLPGYEHTHSMLDRV